MRKYQGAIGSFGVGAKRDLKRRGLERIKFGPY
jgi:hypothetical protein